MTSRLPNLSSQIAQEAFARMSASQHALIDSDPAAWRLLYDDACRRVLAEVPESISHPQLSLPL